MIWSYFYVTSPCVVQATADYARDTLRRLQDIKTAVISVTSAAEKMEEKCTKSGKRDNSEWLNRNIIMNNHMHVRNISQCGCIMYISTIVCSNPLLCISYIHLKVNVHEFPSPITDEITSAWCVFAVRVCKLMLLVELAVWELHSPDETATGGKGTVTMLELRTYTLLWSFSSQMSH